MKCPVCNSLEARQYFQVKNSPRLQNVLYESEAAAREAPVVSADFWRCGHCLLLFNPNFQEQPYSTDYNNDQSCSSIYQGHLADVLDTLRRHLHPEDRIVEIGCGNGALLNHLLANGFPQVEGFDPAHSNALPFVHCKHWKPSGVQYDAIIFRHVLESLGNFREVLAAAIAEMHPTGLLYLELTNSRYILEKGTTVTLYHEYPQYFSETAIGILLDQLGLYVHETRQFSSGQILGVIARRKMAREAKRPSLSILSAYKSVCIWGISGRAIHFLTNHGIDARLIPYGVDIDPRKQGRFVPRTGQRIISPPECVASHPDAVIVLNQMYVAEIVQSFPYPVTILTESDFYND